MKRFIDKFPTLFSLAVFALSMPLVWGAMYPLLYKLPFYWASTIKYTLSFLSVVAICLVVYRKIPFTLQCKGLFKGLFTFGSIGLICAVMAFVFGYNSPDVAPSVSTVFGFILYSLAIAVSEEFLFRGVIFTQMLDSRKDKKGCIWAAMILSSVIFGLRHFLNLVTTPNVVITTVGQALFTFMAGFYLCAVYLRTRNIWICIIIHFLEDFFTGFWAIVSTSAQAAQSVDGTPANMLLLVAVHLVYVIFGVLMIKSKKWQYQPLIENSETD